MQPHARLPARAAEDPATPTRVCSGLNGLHAQVVMAVFSYLYFNSYVAAEVGVTVGGVLSAAMQLGKREQLELWGLMANLLAADDLLQPAQLLGHVERAVAAGQLRLARPHT